MPHLIRPEKKYALSYADALREGLRTEPEKPETIARIENDFDGWLRDRTDLSKPIAMPDGTVNKRVPQYDFWLVDGDGFLGQISVRTELNEKLLEYGGHIGYAVRASERQKGYGKMMMQLVLPEVKKLGLAKALITCDDDNIGSIKIIEGAGGVLENKVKLPWKNVAHRRYWITL